MFAGSDMANGIVETLSWGDARCVQPTLKEMSVKALEILERNEQGFFLIIGSGQIDWVAHRNDTLNVMLDWAESRPAGHANPEPIAAQRCSFL
ncbi:MAG: alkaline phosphatase [Methylobacter sp.]